MTAANEKKEMGVMERIFGIFTSPRETFESIDRKPDWLIPFIIVVVLVLVMQFFSRDIAIKAQFEMMEARGMTAEQIAMAKQQMQGPMQYIQYVAIPIVTLIVWSVIAGIFVFFGNTIMGGEAPFKKMFAVIAWSSFVSLLGGIIKTALIVMKGTVHGVTTSLAMFLPTPAIGQSKPILYRLLARFDIFVIWQMILWIIGIAIIYKFTTKKSATIVGVVWVIWIILAVALGGVFGRFTGM